MLERLFVTRYLFGQARGSVVKTIALMSVSGIGLGAMAMVVVLSVMGGFDEAIKTRLLNVEAHMVVHSDVAADYGKISSIIGDKGNVEIFARQDVILRTVDGIFSGAMARGLEEKGISHLGKRIRHAVEIIDTPNGVTQSATSKTSDIDFNLGPREIAVGIDLARSLGIFEGDEVTVVAPESLLLPTGEVPIFEKVKVRALIRTDVPDIDGHVLFYDVESGLKKLREAASLEKGVEVRLNDPDEADHFADLLKREGIKRVQTWRELNSALFYSLKMEKTLMGVFLALTVLISSFSIVSVLVLLVTEKRRDVGVLKAMGATKGRIKRIFISIGMCLGILGVGGGTLWGLFVCWLLVKYPVIRLPDIYYDTSFPVHVDQAVIVGIAVFGFLLTLGGSLLPAWQAAGYEPIGAIHSEE